HGRAVGRRQGHGGARAPHPALPVPAVLRRGGLHRHARQVRQARGHGEGLQAHRERRARRPARAGVLHARRHRRSDRRGREDEGGRLVASVFKLSILTPEKTVFEGDVSYVEAPGTEGYFGVLASHAALVTALSQGTLTVRESAGQESRWHVAGGFFEVSNNA